MPIVIKDYTWRQTEDFVVIRVPLHNIPHSKVDIFTSDIYIKAHYPPFIFESCLYDRIEEEESQCTLVEGEAVFTLIKKERKEWPTLNKDISKQEMTLLKKNAIELAHAKSSEITKRKKEARCKRQRACCSEQVSLEGDIHAKIEGLKAAAKGEAVREVEEWKDNETDKDFLPDPLRRARAKLYSSPGSKSNKQIEQRVDTAPTNNSIFTETELKRDKTQEDKEVEDTRPMRSCGKIGVNFTFRAFPTPSRESKLDEENEWLKKMAEARRRTGFVVEDLRPEENDPQWLLDKGRSFHDVGNYLGAISAYSHALLTWTKIPELWVARSESQLAVGNFRRVVRDTSEALDLLKPHVSGNAELRFVSHMNRGRALLELGKPEAASADLEEALEIHPYREDLHALMDRAEADTARAREELAKENLDKDVLGEKHFIEPEELAA